jgi:putative phosphoserine phosphatase / 1-acylglycerol-3-phosphate O-acyltransferase
LSGSESTSYSSDERLPPEGEGCVAAFFDMDNTLLSEASGRLYLQWLRKTGQLSLHSWAYISGQVGLYIIGVMSFPRLITRLMVYAGGTDEAEAWRMSEAWFDSMLRHYIADGGRERIQWHRQQGHHVAIVSASTPYAVKPIATALDLGEAYIATELEVHEGRFTGRVIEPACYGAGKVERALTYAARHGIDLRKSYFYSDSASDLPLLEAVGHPVAVNPNRKLSGIAAERGWPVMRFY